MEKHQKYFLVRVIFVTVTFIVFLSNCLNAQLANSPWPMFGHDKRHTFRSTFAVPDSMQLNWALTLNAECNFPPVIGQDGTIYLCAEKLYAIRPNGTIKWESKIPEDGKLYTSPAIDSEGNIIIGGDYQSWYSGPGIHSFTSDGYVNWSLQISSNRDNVSSPVISDDGIIYVGSGDDTLYAINSNGTIKWKYGLIDDVHSIPTLGNDGTIYFLCKDGYIYALRSNGIFKWKYQVAHSEINVSSNPSISVGDDGTIYFASDTQYGSYDIGLAAINPNGTTKWSHGRLDYGSLIAVGSDNTIYSSNSWDIFAVREDGTKKWEFDFPGINNSILLDKNESIYYFRASKLIARLADGSIKWENSDLIANPDVGNPNIGLVLDGHGNIYTIHSPTSYPYETNLCCFSEPIGSGNPDLVVSSINISPLNGTNVGATIEIEVGVQSIADKVRSKCLVSVYYDNFENLIDTTTVTIPTNETGYGNVSWYTQNYEPSTYKIIAVISNSNPNEIDTTNNTADISYPIYTTLQSRINKASPGEIILVEPGTYYENITMRSGVKLISKSGPLLTIIDGQQEGTVINADNLDTTATIHGFTITNGYGKNISMDLTYARVINNIITHARGPWGFGIELRGFEIPLIQGNIICDNNYAINANNSNARIINNTMVDNIEGGVWAIGFYVPTPEIQNCIIWGNNGNDLMYTAQASYSCIESVSGGTGNISANPKFVDRMRGDYHLLSDSPCIDAGNPDPQYNDPEDLDNPGYALYPAMGTIRNDMGAYGGLYSSILTSVEEIKEFESVTPKTYYLFHNFPNPFNTSTIIKYQLPKSSEVSIKIYNIEGQLVKTLVNKKQSEGNYSIIWNGKNEVEQQVASGVYLYQIRAKGEKESYVQTRKMILVR